MEDLCIDVKGKGEKIKLRLKKLLLNYLIIQRRLETMLLKFFSLESFRNYLKSSTTRFFGNRNRPIHNKQTYRIEKFRNDV